MDVTIWMSVLLFAVFIGVVPDFVWSERSRKRDLQARGSVVYEADSDSNNNNCPYPCTCPITGEECRDRECDECPRQAGEPCNQEKSCDIQRGLVCRYRHDTDTEGICKEAPGVPCIVHNRTYEHGETFTLDCRTQCACQNGTYGCSSLCPQEHISPRGTCQHPRLVEVPGQCCREWMCDSQTAEQPPSCQPAFSKWSSCNSDCGAGLSSRRSNLNARCTPDTETRICQTRRCQDTATVPYVVGGRRKKQHHLRRGHECKATHRLSTAVYLHFGPCRSRKRYRPKYCGECPIPGVHCTPTLSTTVKVEFVCDDGLQPSEHVTDLLPEYLEPGEDLWSEAGGRGPAERRRSGGPMTAERGEMTVSVQWVLKCRCEPETNEATSSTGQVILHRVHRTAAPPLEYAQKYQSHDSFFN